MALTGMAISFASAFKLIHHLLRQEGIGFFLFSFYPVLLIRPRDAKNYTNTHLSNVSQYFQELLEQYYSLFLIHWTESQRYCLARVISKKFSRLEHMHWSAFKILKNDTRSKLKLYKVKSNILPFWRIMALYRLELRV